MDTSEYSFRDEPKGVTARLRKHFRWWVAGVIVVVVLAVLGGTAAAMHMFDSPKQLVLSSIESSPVSKPTPVEETLTFQFKNVKVSNGSLMDQALLSSLNDSTMDLRLKIDPAQSRGEVDTSTTYQSVTRHATLWVNRDSAILSAAEYEPLIKLLFSDSVQIPKYLVTDPSQGEAIQRFWSQAIQTGTGTTSQTAVAARQLATIMVRAIPDQYFHRNGLTGITLAFDHKGLEDIVQQEIHAVYANKETVASAVSQLESPRLPPGVTVDEMKQTILDGINNTPEETAIAFASALLGSGSINVHQTTLTVSRPLFGQVTSLFQGGLTFNSPEEGMSGDIVYEMTAGPLRNAITPPTPAPGEQGSLSNVLKQMLAFPELRPPVIE